jgi:anti-sigma regulatory factor (Ser/Thr protein kinase)
MTPAEADRIAVVRRAVGGYARVYGADEEMVDDVLTAISEACTNAVMHAYPAAEDGAIRVEVAHDDPCLFIRVRDWGSGMNPEVEGVETNSLRLGMSLMSALADEFQIRSGPQFGTEVAFIFDLDREPKTPRPQEPRPETEEDVTIIDAEGPGGLAALKSALSMLAARADFSLDRLADLQLLSEVLVERGTPARNGKLRVSISERDDGLRLTVGPLRDGAILPAESENGRLAGLHRIVERLTAEARAIPKDDGEHLEVLVSRV